MSLQATHTEMRSYWTIIEALVWICQRDMMSVETIQSPATRNPAPWRSLSIYLGHKYHLSDLRAFGLDCLSLRSRFRPTACVVPRCT